MYLEADKYYTFMKKQIVFLSLLVGVLGYSQENSKAKTSEKQIEEVTFKKTKKAVEQKADRTIFDFSEQPNLNTGTALEGIKKLPGLMNSELTGMAYQGKPLAVYMDSRPLNITSKELNAFLEGLPASSIDRIEVITNPGAEYPATGGGAIMNIITSRSAKSYLTATYSGSYSFSNYDKYRNKTNQSILLNSKNKWFGWQLNTGMNYRESIDNSIIDDISNISSDGIYRGYFVRTALSFDLGQDRLLLNYNLNHNNGDVDSRSFGSLARMNYHQQDASKTKRLRQEGEITYQKRFDDAGKKLDFKLSYVNSNNDFEQDNLFFVSGGASSTLPKYVTSSDAKMAEFSVNYSQDINLLDMGKLILGGLYERLDYDTEAYGIRNLDYQRQTLSSFAELQTTKGKFDFILGVRGEDYDISGVTYNAQRGTYDDLKAFRRYKVFPNASVQYNVNKMVNVALNYNKKITLPSISSLNPNASDYTNGNFRNTGNAFLQPTIYDYVELRVSAFNYLFLSYDLGFIRDKVSEITTRQGDVVYMTNANIPYHRIHNIAMGFPIPLDIFNKPMKEIMRANPDKMNFLYFVTAYNLQDMPDVKDKPLWYFNTNGQILLPKDIKLNINYTFIPRGAGYYYFTSDSPMSHQLDLTLSKKFMKDRLSVSLFAEDIFNTNYGNFYSRAQVPNVRIYMKEDTRIFGISVNYKIPTKNKLAKENPNLLLENKKEESGGGLISK